MLRLLSAPALLGALALVGCGGSDRPTPTSPPAVTSEPAITPAPAGPVSEVVSVREGVVRYEGIVMRLPASWKVSAVGNGQALDVTVADGDHRAGVRIEPGKARASALRVRASGSDDLNARTDAQRVVRARPWAGGDSYELRSRYEGASLRWRYGSGRGWLLTTTVVGSIRDDAAFDTQLDRALRTLTLPKPRGRTR